MEMNDTIIGKIISNYKILKKIDKGGMGEVYLADDIKLNRKVAIKFLLPQFISDEDMKERFIREARLTAKLSHPNIITIYQVDEYDEKVFIAMEYVEGKSLNELINEKIISFNKALDIAIQICSGLNEAHQAGIIHRDIKPANIRIQKKDLVKILDFGLAKLIESSKKTSKAATMGTLQYLAPEQIGNSDVDHRADIFSLGIVLYKMLTGHLPFAGESEAAIMYSILNEKPEPIARYKSGISDRLQQIIDKTLEKKPEKRYQHIDDLLNDLKREKEINEENKKKVTPALTQSETSDKEIRKLAAIMFIDIVGYSKMMGKDEDQTLKLLQDYDEIVNPIISDNNGVIIKKLGDGLFCEFSSALASVDCALRLQEAFHIYSQDRADDFKLTTRIGIHMGDVVKKSGDLFGDGVNVAARIEPIAPHGGICISESIFSAISSHPRFKIVSMGKKELKNISHQHQLYKIITGYEIKSGYSVKPPDTVMMIGEQSVQISDEKNKTFLSKLIKSKIFLAVFSLVIIFSSYALYKSLFRSDINSISASPTTKTSNKKEPIKTENGLEALPIKVKDILNMEKSQEFCEQIQKIENLNELLNYLQENKEKGKIVFGNKKDFHNQDEKFIIIADDQKIYNVLFYYNSKYIDVYTYEIHNDLLSKFRGMRSIWIELL